MSNPLDYTVGWICAIPTEYVAAQVFLDDTHQGPKYVAANDNNDYALGRIGKHNVVIAVLPNGEYGLSSAAVVGRDMLHSFPNIRIGLMVGIAGGAPSLKHDIRLGDIVVSAPRDGKGGVFQYDFGKATQGKAFQPSGFTNQPPPLLRSAVNGLMTQYETTGNQLQKAIDHVLHSNPKLRSKYKKPEAIKDRLYRPEIIHPPELDSSCEITCGDDISKLIVRPQRDTEANDLAIHYGIIASANQLLKNAIIRDSLIVTEDVLCFEMEATGLLNHFPCLVVRGICDYADSHKNSEWQGYAAMAAAAYAKDLLGRIPPTKNEVDRSIRDTLYG